MKTVEGISELQVPPGTQPGDVLVLAKKGAPKLNKPSIRGDHLFTVKVTIPNRIRYVYSPSLTIIQLNSVIILLFLVSYMIWCHIISVVFAMVLWFVFLSPGFALTAFWKTSMFYIYCCLMLMAFISSSISIFYFTSLTFLLVLIH